MGKLSKWVHAFMVGTHTSSSGSERTYTDEDVQELTDAVNTSLEDDHRIPAVKGHPADDAPAYGWLADAKKVGKHFFVRFSEVDKDFKQEVDDKKYQSVSLRIYDRNHPNNPTPGLLNLGHVGFFGAVQPAVKGMAAANLGEVPAGFTQVDFADCTTIAAQELEEIERKGGELKFGEGSWISFYAFGSIASLFNNLREHVIAKDGTEVADRLIPRYQIEDIRDQGAKEGVYVPAMKDSSMSTYKEQNMDISDAIATLTSQGYSVATPAEGLKAELLGVVEQYRESKGLTNEQITDAIGLDLSEYKSPAQPEPDFEAAAAALNMSVTDLTERIGTPSTWAPATQAPEYASQQEISDVMSELAVIQETFTKLEAHR